MHAVVVENKKNYNNYSYRVAICIKKLLIINCNSVNTVINIH